MIVVVLLLLVLSGAPAHAGQAPASADPRAEAPPAPPASYAYAPDGRRDPFVSLVKGGATASAPQATGHSRPDGLAGVAVDELVVRGLVQSRNGWIAIVGSPSGRTYTVRPGDHLLDGSIHEINAQCVVLMQEVSDPLSLVKQREVRKFLRGEVK
jgi:Tfp pilus assembly protein PilP